jgi:hypothetical protein
MVKQNAITLYLQDEDERRIEKLAKILGLNKSSFCRFVALKFVRENLVEGSV